MNGEEADPKTNVPHLASVLACISILVDAKEMGMLTDDRPPAADMERILQDFEQRTKHLQTIFPRQVAR